MAGKVTIEQVIFPAPTTGNQTLTVQYKLASQPASDYVTFSSSMVVGETGIPVASPLPTITGLTSGVLYNILFTNNCGSPAPYFILNVTPE